MRSRVFLVTFGLCAVAGYAHATPEPYEVALKVVQARGGAEAIKAVASYDMRGTISSEYGKAPLRAHWRRPDCLRIEIGDSSSPLVMATDSHAYWKLEAGPWVQEAESMLPHERDVFSRQADFDSPFIGIEPDDPESWKGLELVWQTPIVTALPDSSTALTYLLSFTDSSGIQSYFRVDRGSGLITWEAFYAGHFGDSFSVEITYADYRFVGGVAFPHRIERFVNGEPYDAVSIDTVIVGLPLDDTLFRMPLNPAGAGSAQVPKLSSVLPLRDAFRADSGVVRLIALLSPT